MLQDLNQLQSNFRDRWQSFLANAGVVQAFACTDLTTLEWLSKRLGTTTVTNMNQAEVLLSAANTTGATGKSWSTGTCPLLTPAEIAQLFGRDDRLLRQLIIRPTVDPIVLQRAFYDKHELFEGKYTAEEDGQ